MHRSGFAILAFFCVMTGLTPIRSHAFTAQLPISRYEFAGPITIYYENIEDRTAIYSVPSNRIAVITDVYVTFANGATGTHKTLLWNDDLQKVAGPFPTTMTSPFVMNYTTGLIWTEGQQILVSDEGGGGAVIVNLVGYLVCRGSCNPS